MRKTFSAYGRDKVEAEVERLTKHNEKCRTNTTDPDCVVPRFMKQKQKYEIKYTFDLIDPDVFLKIVNDHRGYCPYGLHESLRLRDNSSNCLKHRETYLKSFDFSL